MEGYDFMPKKKKQETRFIPVKNYYIAALIFISIILLTLYFFKWYEVKQTEKYRESYLVTTEAITLEVNEENELKQVFMESPEEYFIYIGYRNNKDVYNLEKKLKPIIEDYNLKDIFYYVDATDIKKDKNYLNTLNESLKLTKDKINKVPVIIYFSKQNYEIIDANELDKLLEKKGFEKTAK